MLSLITYAKSSLLFKVTFPGSGDEDVFIFGEPLFTLPLSVWKGNSTRAGIRFPIAPINWVSNIWSIVVGTWIFVKWVLHLQASETPFACWHKGFLKKSDWIKNDHGLIVTVNIFSVPSSELRVLHYCPFNFLRSLLIYLKLSEVK